MLAQKLASSGSTQRYLNFALGENDLKKASQIFTSSIKIHIVVALLILVLSETVGLLFLNHYLVIPEERLIAANFAYQFSVITTIINVLKIPYNATIIAYEKMSFFALLSVIEGVLKLAIVFLLKLFDFDKLILYTILLLFISVIVLLSFVLYVRTHFEICRWQKNVDKDLYKELLSFSGWNLVSSIGDVVSTQGLNFIVNRFFGVIVNAAMGIANQVNNAVYGLISNFQVAFEPQIVKSYASGDRDYLLNLIFKTSKFSYYLLYFFVLPLFLNAHLVLQLWLKEVPEYSVIFLRLTLIYSLINALIGPLWMVVYAIGNIRNYQFVACCNALLQLPLLWICLKLEAPAYTILLIRILSITAFSIWRLFYLQNRMNFPVISYLKKVFWPILVITVLSFVPSFVVYNFTQGWKQFFLSCAITVIFNILFIYCIGCTKAERSFLNVQAKRIIMRGKNK